MLRRLSKRASGALSSPPAPGGLGEAVDGDEREFFEEQVGEFLEDDEEERQMALQNSSEVREWLEHVSKMEISATVSEQVEQKRRLLLKKKNVFTVRARHLDTGDVTNCRRTYNEFRRLQEQLKQRFTGALVPPLPKPNMPVSKMVDWLDLFVSEVARNPLFRSDKAFRAFISVDTKKFGKKHMPELETQSQGLMHWPQVLDAVQLPPGLFDQVLAIRKEITSMHALYSRLCEHVKKLQGHIKRQAREEREISNFYSRWMTKEASNFPQLFGKATDPTGTWPTANASINMPTLLQSMHAVSEARATALEKESEQTLEIVQRGLQAELAYLNELSALMTAVKTAVHKHRASMGELHSLRRQIEINLRRSSVPLSTTKSDSAIETQISNQQLAEEADESNPWFGGGGGGGEEEEEEEEERKGGEPEADADESAFGGRPEDPTAAGASSSAIPPATRPLPKNHAKIERRSVNLTNNIRERQTSLKRLVRGLLFEAGRYRFERTARTSVMLHQLSSAQNAHVESILQVCKETLASLPSEMEPVSHLACFLSFCNGTAGPAAMNEYSSFHSRSSTNSDSPFGSPFASPVNLPPGYDGAQAGNRSSLRAMYDFEPVEPEEVPLRKGDMVEVLEEEDNGDGWCRVRTSTGAQGLAPLAYLQAIVVEPSIPEPGIQRADTGSEASVASSIHSANSQQAISYPASKTDAVEGTPQMASPVTPPGPFQNTAPAAAPEAAAPEAPKPQLGNPLLAAIQGFDKAKLGGK